MTVTMSGSDAASFTYAIAGLIFILLCLCIIIARHVYRSDMPGELTTVTTSNGTLRVEPPVKVQSGDYIALQGNTAYIMRPIKRRWYWPFGGRSYDVVHCLGTVGDDAQ